MKLSNEQFKRFRELAAKIKAKKATDAEVKEFNELQALKKQSASNDLSWWMNYPELTKDVTNIPFNWIPGTRVTINGSGNSLQDLELGLIAMAELAPAIGRSVSDADPFNAQIRQLWLDLHRKYRGLGSYQKSDLGIALIAINSLFENIAKFERMYGVLNAYHIGNRVVPAGLKEALGIDAALEVNLADFRYTLNLYIEKCKQLCLPKGLSVLTSDVVAISNLFKDSKDRRAFIFGYDTDEYGVYDGSIVNTGGTAIGSAVKFIDASSTHMNGVTPGGNPAYTLSDIVNILDEQIDALLNDDDIQIMCSDLLSAYGPENVMTLMSVPTDYKVEPVEDYERSLQFHNMQIVGKTRTILDSTVIDSTLAATLYSNDIMHIVYQKDNTILSRIGKGDNAYYAASDGMLYPTFTTSDNQHPKAMEILFDTWVDSPSETELMCGTRYTAIGGAVNIAGTNQLTQEIYSFGTKLVQRVSVYSYDNTTNTYNREIFSGTVVDRIYFVNNYRKYCRLSQQDWAPIFFIEDSNDIVLFGDVDNFAKIAASNLDRIHEVALLSGYKIPMVTYSK